MRIEKINEDQLKIIINNEELRERDINISELTLNNPEKIHHFFHDILTQAMTECGFHAELSPSLSFQIASADDEGMMIIVTKSDTLPLMPFMDMFGMMNKAKPEQEPEQEIINETEQTKPTKQKPSFELKKKQVSSINSSIKAQTFVFKTISGFAGACQAICDIFEGKSVAYKLNSKYYLMLNFKKTQYPEKIAVTLREFGENIKTTPISLPYLMEHGELLISKNAVSVAAEFLS